MRKVLGFKTFFLAHFQLFGCSVLLVFLVTVLKNLQMEGREIFLLQRKSLLLEVFARTDLKPESYSLVKNSIQSFEGVKEVQAISPEEGLRKVLAEPDLGIEPEWLNQKSAQLKNKNTLLPWTFILHLDQWEQPFLENLIEKIVNLKVGDPGTKAISQVYYDKERWSLTASLVHYVQWITGALRVCALFLFVSAVGFAVRWLRAGEEKKALTKALGDIALLGALSGLSAHFLYLLTLSVYFFSQPFLWKNQLGHFLFTQIALAVLINFLGYASSSLHGKAKN